MCARAFFPLLIICKWTRITCIINSTHSAVNAMCHYNVALILLIYSSCIISRNKWIQIQCKSKLIENELKSEQRKWTKQQNSSLFLLVILGLFLFQSFNRTDLRRYGKCIYTFSMDVNGDRHRKCYIVNCSIGDLEKRTPLFEFCYHTVFFLLVST